MRRRLIRGGIVLLAAALLTACAPAVYTPQQLAQLKARETVGSIVKQSRGSFALLSDDGSEQIYRTGEMTQYLPADYRSQQDDKVRVAYREILERSGRIKYEVLQLEALAIPERNRQLPNPIIGRIVAIGPGGYNYARQIAVRYSEAAEPLAIYLPNLELVVLRGTKETFVSDWESLIGSEVSVTAKRIPILRGNALLYVAQKIVLPVVRHAD